MKPVEVNFLSTPRYCELSTENRHNYYVVRFCPDGATLYLQNMKPVTRFRVTVQTAPLLAWAGKLDTKIRAYMTSTDPGRRKALWWEIHNTLEGKQVAA